MVSLTEVERHERAKEIIDEAAKTAAGAAALLAPGAFLGADVLPQTALAIKMVAELGELFGQRIEKSTAIVLLGQAAGLSAGVGGTRALWGIIPILGNVVNAGATFIHTKLMGWSIYNYFKTEEKLKKVFKESSAEEVKVAAPSEGVKDSVRTERERRESPESNAVRA
jgi:uncharacterized protein (DUF697 family)